MKKGKDITEKLLDEIPDEYGWVKKDFEEILKNSWIKKRLDNAYIETSKKNWINRHGLVHGLKTALNSLRLFKLIDHEIIESSYEKYFGVPRPIILFGLLVASYVHDIGRAFDPEAEKIQKHGERIDDLIKILEKMKEDRILQKVPPIHHHHFFTIVRELCLCHDNKEQPSNKTEIAIMKLADALDCDKDRAYSEEDIEILKDKSDLEKQRLILENDKHPEMYFGCKGIDIISVEWNEFEYAIDVIITTIDNAAVIPINTISKVLKACERSQEESVRSIAKHVRIILREGDSFHFFYGDPQTPLIPNLKFLERKIKLDILNERGDVNFSQFLVIKNQGKKREINGFPISLWGLPVPQSKINFSAHQLIDDKWKTIPVNHVYTFDRKNETEHWWRIKFNDTLKPDEEATIRIECRWEKCVNIKKDELSFRVITSHDSLELEIHFCGEIKKEILQPLFKITSRITEETIYTERIDIEYDTESKRPVVRKTLPNPVKDFIYTIEWEYKRN
ncbi:MAG: HD domain-containing protein [Candidatus Hodarchaeales archaeon]